LEFAICREKLPLQTELPLQTANCKLQTDMETIIIEPGRRNRTYLRDLWQYRDLMVLFVKRDFTARYKQTLLGPLWHFIQPALTTAMSVLLFNVVAGIGTNGVNPVLFQMSGIVIWSYFAACLTNTSNTFIANAGIFGKVYFPRLVSPISVVISQLIQFGIQLFLLICVMLYFALATGNRQLPTANWLLIPIVMLIMAGMGLGLGIIISSITTKYRDFTVLIGFGVQLLMFASAVNYPLSALEKLNSSHPLVYKLVQYNPLATLVELFRNSILGAEVHYWQLAYSGAWMLGLLLIGIRLFSRVEKTFMDTV
jgi:lipopolysaccharide transport system permease protein